MKSLPTYHFGSEDALGNAKPAAAQAIPKSIVESDAGRVDAGPVAIKIDNGPSPFVGKPLAVTWDSGQRASNIPRQSISGTGYPSGKS
jgi:hypothetical protein